MLAENTQTDQRLSLETPTGKGQDDENFPVASVILTKRHRTPVKIFYDFARAADDVADNPDLSGAEKISRLNAFGAALMDEPGAPQIAKAASLRASLASTGLTDRHALDLLDAFRQDAVKSRYESWRELLDYCRLSANPVGRFLLDLHGENPAGYGASDALCTVLQVLNHLQDCGDDKRVMDRVYLPQDWIDACGTSLAVLEAGRSDPGFRQVLDRMLDQCDALLAVARTLPSQLKDTRLAINSAVIIRLAERLSRRLRNGDPLAGRVALSKADFAAALLVGLGWGLFRRRPNPAASDATS